MRAYVILLFVFLFNTLDAQKLVKDQDLVTLKSGAQYLGYIIEQQPGKLIKMYRPLENDTISINMEDIDKFTKIYVQAYAPKKRTKNDSILLTGRFNNKKNVYQFSFVALSGSRINGHLGGSVAYYRSIKNRYMPGISITMAGFKQEYAYTFDSAISTYGHMSSTYEKNSSLFYLMFENKIRVGNLKQGQNHRITGLFGLNVGYVFDFTKESSIKYNYQEKYFEQYQKQTSNAFMFQLSYSIKINPDNNSGFILEPGIAYYSPVTKIYYSKYAIDKQTQVIYPGGYKDVRTEYDHIITNEYIGYTKRYPLLYSFRLSYFF